MHEKYLFSVAWFYRDIFGSSSHLGVEGCVYRQIEPVAVAVIGCDNAIASDTNGLSRTDTLKYLGMKDEAEFRTGFFTIGDFCLSGVTPFGSR
ncbi:hypothetical protein FB472_2755 [Rhodoglobus vestalii]|uniref:Uncharacterized protein n=1 Tax=Rhodoglobus vestalii TaxID=193384 RepID=A0A8H2KBC2_9MICO|nr:hypothetical protein FB472_2755 [Rhodoglobus vestalii]